MPRPQPQPQIDSQNESPSPTAAADDLDAHGPAAHGAASGLAVEASEADPVAVAREIVLRSLSARDHTRFELSRRLAARRVPHDVAQEVLDRFEELGLVDDRAFARRWVESRRERRSLSRLALQRELSSKGVDAELIEEAIRDIDHETEVAAACDLAERRLRGLAGLAPQVRERRLAGVLARRGFATSVIVQALRAVTDRDPAGTAPD